MKKQKAEKPSKLDLNESLTIKNIRGIRDELLQALEGNSVIEVNLERVEQVDLAGLQLLCAAHRFAVKQGKNLNVNDPEEILSSVGRGSGFNGGKKCGFAGNNECIW